MRPAVMGGTVHDERTGFTTGAGDRLPETWVRDCWFIEVMPPTWAWAYRRLLNVGAADPRQSERLP